VYDPCPPGFKIPNGNTFTGFTFDNVVGSFDNGWMFKRNSSDTTGIFFPASGVRYDNGNIGNAGQCSNVWVSASES
jgi:hypothetical protein